MSGWNKLALAYVVVAVCSCGPAERPGVSGTFKGIRYEVEGDSTSTSITDNGLRVESGGLLVEIGEGALSVNGRAMGMLRPGDAVHVARDGSISVNGKARPIPAEAPAPPQHGDQLLPSIGAMTNKVEPVLDISAQRAATFVDTASGTGQLVIDAGVSNAQAHMTAEQIIAIWEQALRDESVGATSQAEQGYAAIIAQKDLLGTNTPHLGDAFNSRGVLRYNAGKYTEALVDFTEAISVGMKDNRLFNRAEALTKLNRYGEALQDYSRALELNANNISALFGKGRVLRDLKQYDAAILFFEKARDHGYDKRTVMNQIGLCHEGNQNYNAALSAFTEALPVGKDFPWPLLNRAVIFEKLGLYESALIDAEKFVGLAPEDEDGAVLLERLKTKNAASAGMQ